MAYQDVVTHALYLWWGGPALAGQPQRGASSMTELDLPRATAATVANLRCQRHDHRGYLASCSPGSLSWAPIPALCRSTPTTAAPERMRLCEEHSRRASAASDDCCWLLTGIPKDRPRAKAAYNSGRHGCANCRQGRTSCGIQPISITCELHEPKGEFRGRRLIPQIRLGSEATYEQPTTRC